MTFIELINNYYKKILNLNNNQIITNIIFLCIIIVCLYIVFFTIQISRLKQNECDKMNKKYGKINGNIKTLDISKYNGSLNEYYINTAYNCCSGGSYKNDYVDTCNLKAILRQGVRCLDFEIYSINNEPVIATSTNDNYTVKETYNYVDFNDAFKIIEQYAFSGSYTPNYQDPLLIHLRIKSKNQFIYSKLADIFKHHSDRMLGNKYSYENYNKNLGNETMDKFMGKYVIIIDGNNNSYLENKQFMEYVNMASNSKYMRKYVFDDIKYITNSQELTDYNRENMSMVLPSSGANSYNSNIELCEKYGCQLVAMRYQYLDDNLQKNINIFNTAGYAFIKKP